MIRVCVCESQPIVIEGLRSSLSEATDLHFAGAVSVPGQTLELLERETPKLCLLDKAFGFTAISQIISDIKTRGLDTVPLLWAAEILELESFRALQVGARGIVKKTLPLSVILDCLRAVANGSVWIEKSISNQFVEFINRRPPQRLTLREEEVLVLVMRGLRNKQIADTLGISAGTVKVHVMHLFEKTGVKDRFELAMYGRKIRGFPSDAQDESPRTKPPAFRTGGP